jgi:hypothetical protein
MLPNYPFNTMLVWGGFRKRGKALATSLAPEQTFNDAGQKSASRTSFQSFPRSPFLANQ